jgi:hypothetical protein
VVFVVTVTFYGVPAGGDGVVGVYCGIITGEIGIITGEIGNSAGEIGNSAGEKYTGTGG